jgi:hypothetical protein
VPGVQEVRLPVLRLQMPTTSADSIQGHPEEWGLPQHDLLPVRHELLLGLR